MLYHSPPPFACATILSYVSTLQSRSDPTLVAQSFYAFQRAREVPLLNDKRDALLSEASSLNIPNETSLQALTLASRVKETPTRSGACERPSAKVLAEIPTAGKALLRE